MERTGSPDQTLVHSWLDDPSDPDRVRLLEEATAASGGWTQLVTVAGQAVLAVAAGPRREICLKLGEWYSERLGAPEFALACYRQVLEQEPQEPRALRGALAAARNHPDPARHREALDLVAARHPSPLERAEAWLEIARVLAAAGDDDAAGQALARACETAPTYADAFEARARHLERTGAAAEARDVWTELAFLPGPVAARAALWVRIAEIGEALGDEIGAADAYRQALVLDPSDERASRGVARLADTPEGLAGTVALLEAELEQNRTERERIALRFRLSRLHESAGALERAAAELEEVLARTPDDVRAAADLERIYGQRGAWRELARTILRQTEIAPDREEKVALYLRASDVYGTRLGAHAQAIELAREAIAIAPDDEGAFDTLARWAEAAGDLDRARIALARCRELARTPERRSDLWVRTAALAERRGDGAAEEEALTEAAKDSPGRRDTQDRLATLLRARGDAVGAARHLRRAIQLSSGAELSERLVELATMEGKDLGLPVEAAEHFLQAAQIRPDDLVLAEQVARAQFEANRPDRAHASLERIAQSLDGKRGERSHQVWSMLANSCGALGDGWGRLAALRHAHEAEPANTATSLALADAFEEQGDPESAAPLLERAFPQIQDQNQKGRIALRIGRAREQQGDEGRSSSWFRRAYEAMPDDLEACQAMALVLRRRCEWRRAADLEEQIADRQAGADRERTLLGLAELAEQQLRDPGRAARAIARAIENGEPSRPLLVRLLGLQTAASRFRDALETLDALEALEDDGLVAARISATRARILRDEKKDLRAAADAFERALDLDPADKANAFPELCAMWAEQKKDAELVTCYRRHVSRLADDPTRRLALCDELGSLCRDELGDLDGAWEAYGEAHALDPESPARIALLADLAERSGRLAEAVTLHHRLAAEPPAPASSLRALRRLYDAADDAVAAGWMGSALLCLDEADDEDMSAFTRTREGVRPPQGLLSEHDWLARVQHPSADPRIGKLLQILAPAVHAVRALPGESFAIEGERPLSPSLDALLEWAPAVLGVPRPAVRAVHGPAAAPEATVYPAGVPFSVVGPLEEAWGPADAAFLLGRHLARYRGDLFVAQLVPEAADLAALVVAALRRVDPSATADGVREDWVSIWSSALDQHLTADATFRLGRLRMLLDAVPGVAAIQRWLQGAELTLARAGLVVAPDLCAAVRQVRRLLGAQPELRETAVQDLVAFACSREHLELRAKLGQRTISPRVSAPEPAATEAALPEPALPELPPPAPALPSVRALLRSRARRLTPRPTTQV